MRCGGSGAQAVSDRLKEVLGQLLFGDVLDVKTWKMSRSLLNLVTE